MVQAMTDSNSIPRLRRWSGGSVSHLCEAEVPDMNLETKRTIRARVVERKTGGIENESNGEVIA